MADRVESLVCKKEVKGRELLEWLPSCESMDWAHSRESGQVLGIGSTDTLDYFARLTKALGMYTASFFSVPKGKRPIGIESTLPLYDIPFRIVRGSDRKDPSLKLHSPFKYIDGARMRFRDVQDDFVTVIRWYFLRKGVIPDLGKTGLVGFSSNLYATLISMKSIQEKENRKEKGSVVKSAEHMQHDDTAREPLGRGQEPHEQPTPTNKDSHRTEYETLCDHLVETNLAFVPDALPFPDELQFLQSGTSQDDLPTKLLIGETPLQEPIFAHLVKLADSRYNVHYVTRKAAAGSREFYESRLTANLMGHHKIYHPFDKTFAKTPNARMLVLLEQTRLRLLIQYYFIAKRLSGDLVAPDSSLFKSTLSMTFKFIAERMSLKAPDDNQGHQNPDRAKPAAFKPLIDGSTPVLPTNASPSNEHPPPQSPVLATPSSPDARSDSATSTQPTNTPPSDGRHSRKSSDRAEPCGKIPVPDCTAPMQTTEASTVDMNQFPESPVETDASKIAPAPNYAAPGYATLACSPNFDQTPRAPDETIPSESAKPPHDTTLFQSPLSPAINVPQAQQSSSQALSSNNTASPTGAITVQSLLSPPTLKSTPRGTKRKADDAALEDITTFKRLLGRTPFAGRMLALHERGYPEFSQEDLDSYMHDCAKVQSFEVHLAAYDEPLSQCENDIVVLKNRQKAADAETPAAIKRIEEEEFERAKLLISKASSLAQINELTKQSTDAIHAKTTALKAEAAQLQTQIKETTHRLAGMQKDLARLHVEMKGMLEDLEKTRTKFGPAFLIQVGVQWKDKIREMQSSVRWA